MSKITFRVDYAKSIRAGVNCQLPPTVTIDVDVAAMSQEDRDTLASYVADDGIVRSRSESGDGWYSEPILADAPMVEAVLAAIRANLERRRNYEARQQAKLDAELAAYAAKTDAELLYSQCSHSNDYQKHLRTWFVREHGFWSLADDSPAQLRFVAARKVASERNSEIYAALDAEIARRNAERTAWIAQHGSRRLQRMVAEGISHGDTYAKERGKWDKAQTTARLAEERPGWMIWPDNAGKPEPAHDVPESALAILDAARAIAKTARLAKLAGRWVAVETWGSLTIYWPKD